MKIEDDSYGGVQRFVCTNFEYDQVNEIKVFGYRDDKRNKSTSFPKLACVLRLRKDGHALHDAFLNAEELDELITILLYVRETRNDQDKN